MTTADLASVVKSIAPVIREYVAASIGSVVDRLKGLEERVALVKEGPPGPPGERGESVMGPTGPEGAPGKDAQPVDVDLLVQRVAALVPVPNHGADGKDGKDGQSVSLTDVEPMVQAEVMRAVAALPPAKDGENGKDVDSVLVQAFMDDLKAFRFEVMNLKTVTPSFVIDDEGDLLQATGTEFKRIGRVRGKDGTDGSGEDGKPGQAGRDGVDGVGFDDFDEEIEDGGRFIVHRYRQGERVKEFRHQMATQIYRGIWEPERTYEPGDNVTFGSSQWNCIAATTAKPGESADASRAWRLAVKKGRDGRDSHGR